MEPMGLFCPNHPKITPQSYKVSFKVSGTQITRRFREYKAAFHFLASLRVEQGEGKFDYRDYQVGKKPLSFSNLLEQWLEIKKLEIKPISFNSLSNKVRKASSVWGDTNIKNIDYGHIEDLMQLVTYSAKSKKDMLAGLKAFFTWAKKRHGIDGPADWPKMGAVEMRFRNTISLFDQEAIINHIKEHESFRVWLAIKWLATYISIRPGELLSLTESQVDRQRGILIIPHPKEKKPKIIPLTEEDVKIIREIPLGLPGLKFFRHFEPLRLSDKGKPFHHSYIYKAWKRACAALGIADVDLYGGTKHSTAMGLREVATFEEVRTMTGHATNKAFERYFRAEGKDLKALYERRKSVIEPDNQLTTKNDQSKIHN
jgi:integrase